MSKLFEIGSILATPGSREAMNRNEVSCLTLLHRHMSGDYGDICDGDRKINNRAVKTGGRIMSSYTLKDGTRVWLITEADRSVTTFLLPSEY